MNKDQRTIVTEYAASLSEETLRLLTLRLAEKLFGDIAEALEEMSYDRRMDVVLASAESADELFTLLDQIREIIQKECKRKGMLLKLASV